MAVTRWMISFASLQQFCHQKVPRRIWEALNFMLEPHTRQICGDCARRKNLVKKATLRILVYPVPKRLKIQWEENPETDQKTRHPVKLVRWELGVYAMVNKRCISPFKANLELVS